jgi:hypothetical protein
VSELFCFKEYNLEPSYHGPNMACVATLAAFMEYTETTKLGKHYGVARFSKSTRVKHRVANNQCLDTN